jgi:hypothetical protein
MTLIAIPWPLLYMVLLTVGELGIVINAYTNGASPFFSIWHVAAVLAISASRSSLRLADCRLQHSPELSRFLLVKPLFEQHGAQHGMQHGLQHGPETVAPAPAPAHRLRLIFVCDQNHHQRAHSLSAMMMFLQSLQTPVELQTIEQLHGRMEGSTLGSTATLFVFCIETAAQALEYTAHFAGEESVRQLLVVSQQMLHVGQREGAASGAGGGQCIPMGEELARYSPLVLGDRRFSRDFMLALSTKLITILHGSSANGSVVSRDSVGTVTATSAPAEAGSGRGDGGPADAASAVVGVGNSGGGHTRDASSHQIDYTVHRATAAMHSTTQLGEKVTKVFV